MFKKIFPILVVVVAVLMAVLVSVLPPRPHIVSDLMLLTRFFDVMLPILAVGALVKYLFSSKL